MRPEARGVYEPGRHLYRGHTQHRCNRLIVNFVRGESAHLIKQRQSVTHTALRRAGNRGRSRRFKCEALSGCDLGQPTADQLRAYRPKLELLAARKDGSWNLETVSGGENPEDVWGRFLEALEKGVEGW